MHFRSMERERTDNSELLQGTSESLQQFYGEVRRHAGYLRILKQLRLACLRVYDLLQMLHRLRDDRFEERGEQRGAASLVISVHDPTLSHVQVLYVLYQAKTKIIQDNTRQYHRWEA